MRLARLAALASLAALTAVPALAAAQPLPLDPAWWTPDARLSLPAGVPGLGPPDADFALALRGWTLRGPGRVDARTGGPFGAYAAIRDNTTLVSGLWTAPRGTQVLTLWARALQTGGALRVLAALPGRPQPLLLGTLEPGRSWAPFAVNATALARHSLRLLLDPVVAFGDGIDVTLVGRPQQVAPRFTLAGGAALRSHGGPAGAYLIGQPGPLAVAGAAIRVPRDAVTASVWIRATEARTPDVALVAGSRVLGEAEATTSWQPLRVPIGGIRGRAVRLTVKSSDAAGLQLAWLGTVQRAPTLRLLAAHRQPGARVRVQLSASQALAGSRVRLERSVGAGWAFVTNVRVPPDGKVAVMPRVPAGHPLLRAAFDGNEAVAPGVSAPRPVKGP